MRWSTNGLIRKGEPHAATMPLNMRVQIELNHTKLQDHSGPLARSFFGRSCIDLVEWTL